MEAAGTFDIIINSRSGTVLNAGEGNVRQELSRIFNDRVGNIVFVAGSDVKQSVQDWLEARQPGDGRGLIIGGGDGTVLTAATQFMNTGATLGVLPLGTNNLFARTLGFSPDYREAAAQYIDCRKEDVDVGKVNDLHFLVGLLIDGNSVRFFEGREEVRGKNAVASLPKLFSMVNGLVNGEQEKYQLTCFAPDGERHTEIFTGSAFSVTNNPLTPRPSHDVKILGHDAWKEIAGNAFAKYQLNSGELAFYAYQGTKRTIARATDDIWNGVWDKQDYVTLRKAQHMSLLPEDSVKQDETPIILDGEIMKTHFPLEISILPGVLNVFRPAMK